MGLINVQLDSGLFAEPFVAEKEVMEVSIRGNDRPYFQGIKRSPLVFSLTFAFKDSYDESKIRDVARWLDKDHYCPFYTASNPERIFYCMLYSDSQLLHNGLRQGYIQLQMRCSDPYSYSPVSVSRIYEWRESPLTMNDNHFSQGSLDQLIMNNEGHLQLDANKTKWINISPSKTWSSM
ncbi:hypothetical protein J2TS4_18150 [Paenibacillus sp. J2TS4]|nr:hypothetical protein J2TS4_18150 [Paenibacillus sp. J2TS4]